MILKKTLPRFFKKNKNNLVFFRKTSLVAALKKDRIVLFFPAYCFSSSQWLNLRRELFNILPEALFLAGAPAFPFFLPLNFCSANNNFIISLPHAEALAKLASLLFEKSNGILPCFVFLGSNCLNLQEEKGFMTFYQTFVNKTDSQVVIINNLSKGVLYLIHILSNHFSYFCLIIINYLQAILTLIAHYCFHTRF